MVRLESVRALLRCRAEVAFAVASLAIGLFITGSTLWTMFLCWVPLPLQDQWDELVSGRSLTWSWMFSQHNEHRLFVSRIIYIIDAYFFKERGIATIFLNVFSLFATLGLINLLACRARLDQNVEQVWVLGVSASLIFFFIQAENLLLPFNVHFFLVDLCALATFGLISLRPPRPATLVGAISLGAIATYTLANGLLVTLIAVPLARYLRWPAQYVFSLAVAAIVLIGCYLLGYQRPAQHSDPITSLSRVGDVARYVFTALGHPIGIRREISPFAGVIGLGLFGYLVFRACRERCNLAPAQKALLATMIWVLATVVVTALGRLNFGNEQALSSRYTSPTLLFWLSLIILYASLSRETASIRFRTFTSWTKLLMLLLLVAMSFYQTKFTRRASPQGSEIAAAALLTGVTDPKAFGMIYLNREISLVDRAIPLRAAHASIFADPWTDWLGTQLDDHLTLGSTCLGTLDTLIELEDSSYLGRKAVGQIPSTFVNGSMFRIVLADASRKIIGYGVGGFDLRTGPARFAKEPSKRRLARVSVR